MTLRSSLCSLFIVSLFLTACGHRSAVLPAGEQTLRGIVKPTEISLIRRGTHILLVDGQQKYYLESATVNLATVEGREVEVTGMLEQNTDPTDLPVLVVKEIVGGPSTIGRTWNIASLGIALSTPKEWKGSVTGANAQFTASGSSQPILMVFLEGADRLLTSSSATGADVSATKFIVGTRAAIRVYNAKTGNARIQIDLRPQVTDAAKNVLTLLFQSSGEAEMDPDAWKTLIQDIALSVHFQDSSASSSSSSKSPYVPLSGSGVGMPCGGAAGVLCPKGLYCNIKDTASNTGQCARY